MVLQGENEQEVQNSLKNKIKSLSLSRKHEVNLALEKGLHRILAQNINLNNHKKTKKCNILFLDSDVLSMIIGNYENLLYFQMLALMSDSFILSGLTPEQKAEIVRIVKTFPEHPTCLAVGAGINDILMM